MSTTTGVRYIDPLTVNEWMKSDSAVLIDVREPFEHAEQRIAGSTLLPLSSFDPAAVPAGGGSSRVVVCCRTGVRSAKAAARCAEAGFEEVYVLGGGIEGWRSAGLETKSSPKAPRIGVLRQVQIASGTLVVAGSLLGAFVSPWFFILSGFVGAGLAFSGLTGTCGMARALALAPWNRGAVDAGVS